MVLFFWLIPHPPAKFHSNPFSSFCVNQPPNKHYLTAGSSVIIDELLTLKAPSRTCMWITTSEEEEAFLEYFLTRPRQFKHGSFIKFFSLTSKHEYYAVLSRMKLNCIINIACMYMWIQYKVSDEGKRLSQSQCVWPAVICHDFIHNSVKLFTLLEREFF